MKSNLFIVGAFAVGIMMSLWTACSGTPFDGCVQGTEGCACAPAGDCQRGLTCLSSVCVSFDGGIPAGSGGSNVASGGAGGGSTAGAAVGGAAGDMAGPGGSGGGSTSGTGGGPSGTQTLGATCAADHDCVQGLGCIGPTDKIGAAMGGIGNGVCTRDCSLDRAVCGTNGSCITLDVTAEGKDKSVCLETCALGANVAKCHGRRDFACAPLDSTDTSFGCIPICVTDADCAGRRCDALTGLCVDVPATGKPLGSGCTVTEQSNDECAGGVCLPIDASDAGVPRPGVCSALCRLGTPAACGFRAGPLGAGPPAGVCALPYGDAYDDGDLGLCLQLCDTPSDCRYHAPNWTCRTDLTAGGHSICLTPN